MAAVRMSVEKNEFVFLINTFRPKSNFNRLAR